MKVLDGNRYAFAAKIIMNVMKNEVKDETRAHLVLFCETLSTNEKAGSLGVCLSCNTSGLLI